MSQEYVSTAMLRNPPLHRKPYDLMSVNHFAIYFCLGMIIPHNYILCILLSIVWELFETGITRNSTAYALTKKYWFVPEYYWNENHLNKKMDILFNILGYITGSVFNMFLL